MWRRTARDRVTLLLLGVATITLLTLNFRTSALDGLASGVSQVVGVFQTGVRTVVRPVEGVLTGIQELGELREDNERLRKENADLREQRETYANALRENNDLRELLKLESDHQLTTVRARVVGASLSGLERSVTIDKGKGSGIEDELAVAGPEGLVGRTTEVKSRTSKVLLLTDARSSVGVRLDRSGETGVVSGRGDELLLLELVSARALDEGGVKVNDLVLTTGREGGIFPAGIPVGRVERVDPAERGTTYRVLVRPFSPMTRLDVVSVVGRAPIAPVSDGEDDASE